MYTHAFRRLQKECLEALLDSEMVDTGVSFEVVDEQFSKVKAQIRGPPDTPYAGGIFQLDIDIPDEYPWRPPKVKFVTKVWHPNVSWENGTICVDILKDQWTGAMRLHSVLLSIQSLLGTPEPKKALDEVVSRQCLKNPLLFKETTEFWTQHYAQGVGPKNPHFLAAIQQLVDMEHGDSRLEQQQLECHRGGELHLLVRSSKTSCAFSSYEEAFAFPILSFLYPC